jgi:hypothetical protein
MHHHFHSEEVVVGVLHQELVAEGGFVDGYPAPSISHQPVAYLGFRHS